MLLQELHNAGKRRDLAIMPQAKIAMRNAAIGSDSRRLDHHGAEAAERKAPELHQMLVIGNSVCRGILADRRKHDPVLQRDAA